MLSAILIAAPPLGCGYPVKAVFGTYFVFSNREWRWINLGFAALCALLGSLNLIIAFAYTKDDWDGFKFSCMVNVLAVFLLRLTFVWIDTIVRFAVYLHGRAKTFSSKKRRCQLRRALLDPIGHLRTTKKTPAGLRLGHGCLGTQIRAIQNACKPRASAATCRLDIGGPCSASSWLLNCSHPYCSGAQTAAVLASGASRARIHGALSLTGIAPIASSDRRDQSPRGTLATAWTGRRVGVRPANRSTSRHDGIVGRSICGEDNSLSA
jgi:hypothetical protein